MEILSLSKGDIEHFLKRGEDGLSLLDKVQFMRSICCFSHAPLVQWLQKITTILDIGEEVTQPTKCACNTHTHTQTALA